MRATRTYLEMTEPSQFRPALGEFPDVMVERVADPAPTLYRACYQTVGAGFHWRDRWHWTDADQNFVANLIAGKHVAPDKAAETWVKANGAKVNTWLGK